MKIRTRFLNELLAAATVGIGRLLFRTLRNRAIEADPCLNPVSGWPEPAIYLVWHDAILIPAFLGKLRPAVALVSQHRDGSFLAASLRRLDIGQVRGSSSRGGASAMLKLLDLAPGAHLIITPDGPRGPRRQIKLGPVFLASRSGRPIVPTAYACVKSWNVKGTWTDLQIPKPFTTVHILVGEPIKLPPDLSRDQLIEAEKRVQAALDALTLRAERLARGEEADPETAIAVHVSSALKRAG